MRLDGLGDDLHVGADSVRPGILRGQLVAARQKQGEVCATGNVDEVPEAPTAIRRDLVAQEGVPGLRQAEAGLRAREKDERHRQASQLHQEAEELEANEAHHAQYNNEDHREQERLRGELSGVDHLSRPKQLHVTRRDIRIYKGEEMEV